MVKAKAKADRAAARQAAAAAQAASSSSAALPSGPDTLSASPDESQTIDAMSVDPQSIQDTEEALPQLQKEPATDRTELLRSKPEVVGRFLHLMVPILVDVYAASVITPVRIKTLTGLLKAVSFLDGEELKQVFTVRLSAFDALALVLMYVNSSSRLRALLRPFSPRRTILRL